MIFSDLVKKRFSRNPEYYDSQADVQKTVSANLAEMISASVDKSAVASVMEIGCGTGFLTRRLFRLFPDAEFAVTDLSPAMFSYCERSSAKLADELGVSARFEVFDASHDSLNCSQDLITSSLAFQWIENFADLFERSRAALSDGGTLAFATLAEGTFSSVLESFASHGMDLPMPALPNFAELRVALANFADVEFRHETLREEFDSMGAFLRHLREIGAGNATGKPLPTGKLAKLIRERGDERIVAEYEVAYAICRRS